MSANVPLPSDGPVPPARARGPLAICDTCAARAICVFHADEEAFAKLAPLVTQLRLSPRQVLYEQGAHLDSLYVVKLGTLFVHRQDFGLAKRPIAVLPRGTILGASAYAGQVSQVSAEAASPVRVCSLPIRVVQDRALQSERLASSLTTLMTRSVSQLMQWTAAIGERSVAEKVARGMLLLSQHSASERITLPPQTRFAALLGTTRESVVRGLRTLASNGCIRQVARSTWDVTPALRPWLAQRAAEKQRQRRP